MDRFAASADVDDIHLLETEGGDVKGKIEIDPPTVSNPLSGDESWEASSPESLSPNAPIDDHPSELPIGGDPFLTKSAAAAVDAAFLDSPDVESGFAELSAANSAAGAPQLPLIEGGIASKDYRALVEMSSGMFL